jgi:hypothetical protein
MPKPKKREYPKETRIWWDELDEGLKQRLVWFFPYRKETQATVRHDRDGFLFIRIEEKNDAAQGYSAR